MAAKEGSPCYSVHGAFARIAGGELVAPDGSGGFVWRKAWGDLYGVVNTWQQAFPCTSVDVSLKVDGELVYSYSSCEVGDACACITWKDDAQGHTHLVTFHEDKGFGEIQDADTLPDRGAPHDTLVVNDDAKMIPLYNQVG